MGASEFYLEVWFDAIRDGWVVTVWFTAGDLPDEDDRFVTLAEAHVSRAVALAKARHIAEKLRCCDYEATVMPIRPRQFEDTPDDVAAAIEARVNSLAVDEKELATALLTVVDPMQRLGLVMAVEGRSC